MSEDAAFIRAIRERPDDETSRLVYADWLDDRSDPRAEYLRAEATWVALQPSDEQYRPLYRRVSQLAAQLDLEWFAAVSRMRQLVRKAWEPLVDAHGIARLQPDQPQDWGESYALLQTLLTETFSPSEVCRRFCLPVDFVAFMVAPSAKWKYSGNRLLGAVNNLVAEFPDVPLGSMSGVELWLPFADEESSRYYVCCDLDTPTFGVATVGSGAPWRTGSTAMNFCGRNILHFLDNCRAFIDDGSGEWPHVPRSEWATF